jgi:hypothetical protein
MNLRPSAAMIQYALSAEWINVHGVSEVMTPISLSKDTTCTCEAEESVQTSFNPDCPLHGRRYKLNPKFATNSWLQPYISEQS